MILQETFSTVWLSSINHMNQFSEITKTPIWKMIFLGVKVPPNFPQIKLGYRVVPIVYFSEGALHIFESKIEFHCDFFSRNGNFRNLRTDTDFEIDFMGLQVEKYLHPKPFMKSFNIPWIKISSPEYINKDPVLLSFGAVGVSTSQINSTNERIFEILKNRVKT